MFAIMEVDIDDIIDKLSKDEKIQLAHDLAEKYLDNVELTRIALDNDGVCDVLDTVPEEDLVQFVRVRGYKVEEEIYDTQRD